MPPGGPIHTHAFVYNADQKEGLNVPTTITCQPSPLVNATARVGFMGLAGLLARGMTRAPLARFFLRCCRVVPMTTSVVTCHKALLERTRIHGPSREAQPIAARLHQSAGPVTEDDQEEALLSEPSPPFLRAAG